MRTQPRQWWFSSRRRSDPVQYDILADEWWAPRGSFITLHWLAAARANFIPPAPRQGAILVDVACGGGLLHPHIEDRGYVHVGVDLSHPTLRVARDHGVDVVLRGDMHHIPLADEVADVVHSGYSLEHVIDPEPVLAEFCRILRPGGVLVLDTLANTWLARVLVISIGEALPLPGMAERGIHDHRLFVDRDKLIRDVERFGVELEPLQGEWPNLFDIARWMLHLRKDVRVRIGGGTSVAFLAVGRKVDGRDPAHADVSEQTQRPRLSASGGAVR